MALGACVGCIGEGLADVEVRDVCAGGCSDVVQALSPRPAARSIMLMARDFVLELFR